MKRKRSKFDVAELAVVVGTLLLLILLMAIPMKCSKDPQSHRENKHERKEESRRPDHDQGP